MNVYREDKDYLLELNKKTNYTDLDLEFYGKLIVDTDFHSDPKLRAEIGFKKRL